MALVGDRQETRAVGGNAKPRHAAEIGMRGFQDQSAAKRQRAKARARRLARVEGFDRLGADRDPLNIISRARRLRRRRNQRERKEGQQGRTAGSKTVQGQSP